MEKDLQGQILRNPERLAHFPNGFQRSAAGPDSRGCRTGHESSKPDREVGKEACEIGGVIWQRLDLQN